MKRERAKLANDSTRAFHYNTRSSTSRNETGDAIVESTSAPLRVTKRRKKISADRRTESDFVPIDIVMKILKQLPVKTLTRFLCVSKLWASTMRLPYFKKLFLTESLNRPARLLITFKRHDDGQDCFFFSSNQTRNPGEATYQKLHPSFQDTVDSSSVHGLFCYKTACASRLVVYNSCTRRSITLPQFEHKRLAIKHLLGYDPIDDVYKVLCLTELMSEGEPVFQVLTLGNGHSWKMIENNHPHFPLKTQICINGVVYYEAITDKEGKEAAVMSFDVRTEKFNVFKRPDDALYSPFGFGNYQNMIWYEGKLAVMCSIVPATGSIVLWVLEDAVKHEWSKKVFVLPHSWESIAQGTRTSSPRVFYCVVDVTDAGEFLLAPILLQVPLPTYYVLYYDPKRNSVRKVEIEGITEHKLKLRRYRKPETRFRFHLFSSQFESLMFL